MPARFPKMKKSVIIVNCARGEIVNTNDLIVALKSGQIGGYGTDVLDKEPPPADYPLLKLPNVVCTPHIGSRTCESVVRQATTTVKKHHPRDERRKAHRAGQSRSAGEESGLIRSVDATGKGNL